MGSRSIVDRADFVRRGCDRGPFSTAGHLPGGRMASRLIAPALDRLLGLNQLQALYDGNPGRDGESFVARALRALDVNVDCTGAPHAVPASGGLLVVANHPTGPLDGLALLSALQRVRTDVKVLGSYLLGSIPELRELLVDVDPFASRSARRSNIRGVRAAIRWLSAGGCLLAFPSGEVAHRSSSPEMALDESWRTHLGAL